MNPKEPNSRTTVLSRVRSALATADEPQRARAVAERLKGIAPHLIPERTAGKDADGLKTLLRQFLEGQSATVLEVATAADVPAAVAGYLRNNNLPQRVRMGADGYLADVPWSAEGGLTIETGKAAKDDEVGLVHASSAVAETGTLVMASGADNPVTLNFLPENSIVVLRKRDIVGPYEQAFARARDAFGRGVMPRTLNFVSGPSRTGDIGGKLVMGAHGPRRLCVVIVGE